MAGRIVIWVAETALAPLRHSSGRNAMKKLSIITLALLFVLATATSAQNRRRQRPPNGGGETPPPVEKNEQDDKKKKKEADLSVAAMKAKWKDAKTLEITVTIRNGTSTPFTGARVLTIKFTGKDGKTETAKEDSVTGIAGGESQTVKFETTDEKYFDKAAKWTAELSAGDPSAANDKKGPVTLEPGTRPKG
jgi:hypothetical protein